ncbi:Lacal_2735 family protein [Flavobacteriales bacterium]|nr:Lacal_2735 family protein [Flavobacteriales bacterium]
MFGIFKKKTEAEKLQEEYAKLMKEAFDLSKTNRTKSDEKTAEAEEVLKKIELLKN